MWYTAITVLHVIVCFFLATVVLLQQGKGSDVSAVFGGSSQTLFGSSGAGNLLTKLTSASAIIFMLTSLTLTYGAAKQSTKSLFDSTPSTIPAPTATPENAPATQFGTTTEEPKSAVEPSATEATSPQSGATAEKQSTATTSSASTPASPPTPTATPAPQESSSAPPATSATK